MSRRLNDRLKRGEFKSVVPLPCKEGLGSSREAEVPL